MARKITVLVIDDSQLFRTAIANGLRNDPDIDVVGTASDAFDARDKILALSPDIVTLDVEMPKMNGVEFLRKVMPQYPLKAIVVSSLNGIVFDALNAGAIDFMSKPSPGQSNYETFIKELAEKLKTAVTVDLNKQSANTHEAPPTPVQKVEHTVSTNKYKGIIALGASTGGTEATIAIMKELPADTPGMIITQHMPPLFTKMYADRLNALCAMTVKEATEGAIIQRGTAYIAPGDRHMTVKKVGAQYIVSLSQGEKVSGHCPSVDVLFNSVAKAAPKDSIGIILTGMGSDGAKGLLAMREAGCYTIGQDEKTSVVYGMPGVAKNIGAVIKQAPLNQIAQILINYLKSF